MSIEWNDVYPVKNRAKGKLPVATTWDVNPTNLANATDGDFDTVTGTGSRVLGAGGNLGFLTIDLGAVYNVFLRGKFGMWSTVGNVFSYFLTSDDGVTYRQTSWYFVSRVLAQIAEYVSFTYVVFARARYIQVLFSGDVAMTGYVKIYELQAIDFGI